MTDDSQIIAQVFDRTGSGLALLDTDYNFVRVNQTFADHLGRPTDFFPGRNHFDVCPWVARQPF